ncbi:acyl-CoA thioesterase [Bacteroidota bacterium]
MIEKIRKSETKQSKVIFPNVLNDHNTLFGGTAMQWMDEVAYITATRFTKKKMVTVSTSEIHFRNAVKSGTIAEITGNIIKIGKLKIDIKVEIYVEEMYTESKFLAADAIFTFVAIDNENKAIRMNYDELLVHIT